MMTPGQQAAAVRDGEAVWCEAPGCDGGRVYHSPVSALWEPCGWCGGEGVLSIDPEDNDEPVAVKRVETRRAA